MKKMKFLFTLLVGVTLITSCRKDKEIDPQNNGQPNQVAVGTLDLGNTVNADFQGRVVDEDGNPLANVLITAGSETVYTDDNGLFVLKDVNVKEKLAYIKAQKSGYFPGSRSVIPSTTSANAVVIQMMALNVAGTIQSGTAATVTTNGGASIDFNGLYVDGSGNPYSGPVTVAAKYLPALDPETSAQMPGMLYAENAGGDAGALMTYGMVVVELYGTSGQSLNIAEGSFATLNMPVDEDQLANAPATIPLWFFDEVAGYWIEEGSATLIDGKYIGNVSHFTFWNCDAFADACLHNGVVTDDMGNPVGNATILVDCGWTSSVGYSNPDGTFFTYLPAGQAVDFVISYGCGGTSNTYTVGPYTSGSVSSGTYVAPTPGSVLNITGTLVDCDLNPVTDGYVYFFIGYDYFMYQVTNGIIDFDIPNCGGATTADIYIYDNNQPWAYFSGMSTALTLPSTDLGQVVICDTVGGGPGWVDTTNCTGGYMQVTIDGSLWYADSCLWVDYYNDSLGGPNSFYIYSYTGVYGVWGNGVDATGMYPGTDVTGNTPGEVIYWDNSLMTGLDPVNYTTNITQFDGSGGQVVLTLTGTFVDNTGATRSVDVTLTANIP